MSVAVSVVVPVRNGEATIAACVRSILAAEAPSGGVEIIVVDNGSTDSTARIIRQFPVRLLSASERPGSYYARNEGAAISGGRVLAFTDSDCEVEYRWLTTAISRFGNGGIGLVAGGIKPGFASTRSAWYQCRTKALDQERTLTNSLMPYAQTANCLVSREAFEFLGGFDDSFESGGDADLCWRLQMHTKWKLVYEPSCRVIHHHRSTWRGVFQQSATNAKGFLALEQKYRALYLEQNLPLRSSRGPIRVFGHAAVALGGRAAALLLAVLRGRADQAWHHYGDLVRSAGYHTVACGRTLRIV